MHNRIGIILAAGNQKRLNNFLPKVFHEYKDTTVLNTNVNTLNDYVDKIYVVLSKENKKLVYENFENYCPINMRNKLIFVLIESGQGCGDALYKTLDNLYDSEVINYQTQVILTWGDSIQENPIVIDKMIESYDYDTFMSVPVVYETSPYVRISDTPDILGNRVYFSKYSKQNLPDGFHDLSIFLFNYVEMFYMSSSIQKDTYDPINKKYVESFDGPIRNGEFIFLDILNLYGNYTDENKTIKLIDMTNYNIKAKSFNTLEEYEEIIGEKNVNNI